MSGTTHDDNYEMGVESEGQHEECYNQNAESVKKSQKKSSVWKHFPFDGSQNRVICLYCRPKVSFVVSRTQTKYTLS